MYVGKMALISECLSGVQKLAQSNKSALNVGAGRPEHKV